MSLGSHSRATSSLIAASRISLSAIHTELNYLHESLTEITSKIFPMKYLYITFSG